VWVAVLLVCVGLGFLVVECLRPGLIVPGVGGAFLVVLGAARLAALPDWAWGAAVVAAVAALPLVLLLRIALRARRNKFEDLRSDLR
jgi:membrane protein implicated in regulation of membrane protease activity